MGKQWDTSGDFDMQKAMDFAAKPAGHQLLKLLQSQNNPTLQNAMNKAAAGDYASAQQLLSSLTADPQIRDLLKALEG